MRDLSAATPIRAALLGGVVVLAVACASVEPVEEATSFLPVQSDSFHPEALWMAEVDEKPQVLVQRAPDYPQDLLRQGVSGKVELLVLLDPEGKVVDAAVASASDDRFSAAALAVIHDWRFAPARHQGRPVAIRMRVPLTFQAAAS